MISEYRCPDPSKLGGKKIVFIIDKNTPLPSGSFCKDYWIYDLNLYNCFSPISERKADDRCHDWDRDKYDFYGKMKTPSNNYNIGGASSLEQLRSLHQTE